MPLSQRNKYIKDGAIKLIDDKSENVALYEVWVWSEIKDCFTYEVWDMTKMEYIDTARIGIPKYFNRYIGTYLSREEAEAAYDKAVRRYCDMSKAVNKSRLYKK